VTLSHDPQSVSVYLGKGNPGLLMRRWRLDNITCLTSLRSLFFLVIVPFPPKQVSTGTPSSPPEPCIMASSCSETTWFRTTRTLLLLLLSFHQISFVLLDRKEVFFFSLQILAAPYRYLSVSLARGYFFPPLLRWFKVQTPTSPCLGFF